MSPIPSTRHTAAATACPRAVVLRAHVEDACAGCGTGTSPVTPSGAGEGAVALHGRAGSGSGEAAAARGGPAGRPGGVPPAVPASPLPVPGPRCGCRGTAAPLTPRPTVGGASGNRADACGGGGAARSPPAGTPAPKLGLRAARTASAGAAEARGPLPASLGTASPRRRGRASPAAGGRSSVARGSGRREAGGRPVPGGVRSAAPEPSGAVLAGRWCWAVPGASGPAATGGWGGGGGVVGRGG